MKETSKKILSVAMAGVIVTASGYLVGVSAKTPVENNAVLSDIAITDENNLLGYTEDSSLKEEVIYVNLKANGEIEDIYVVNSFIPGEAEKVTDFGDYVSIKNLSTTDKIEYKDGKISIPTASQKIYYQGKLDKKDIPWDMKFSYKLDGKDIQGEDLAGKSGRLDINIDIKPNPNAPEVYKDNFALQGSATLDSEKISNLEAPDATLANKGDKKMLSYIVLPGKEENISISADVIDFEMDSIMFNALPLTLNIDDPDTAEIKDRIYDLQDGAVELDDGAIELDDGATKLGDGVETLRDGVETLRDGTDELYDGTIDLYDGTSDLVSGVSKLKGGASRLDNGAKDLQDGSQKISNALDKLDSNSEPIVLGMSQMQEGLGKLDESLEAISPEMLETYGEKGRQLAIGSKQYIDTLDKYISDIDEQIGLLSTVVLGESGQHEYLQGQYDTLVKTRELLLGLRAGYADINDGVQLVAEKTNGAAGKVLALQAGVNQLHDASIKLGAGVAQYTGGVNLLSKEVKPFVAGVNKLKEGTEELREGVVDLDEGADELHEGAFDLRDGGRKLNDGTLKLDDGLTELYDGTVDLKDGTIELVDGTKELRDETADIDTEVDDRIDELMEEYRNKDFDMPSFVDERNTNVDSLQFVIRTPDIHIKDEKVVNFDTQVEAEPQDFKSRLMALFNTDDNEK